ncbi:ATP-binding protein [Thorsellia anophelis]|uniref:MoxR-like ATPase n=1 Tax=Thorsellia anophelis DSM 18579 TaxID=1123402 RepID=A0A1I0CMM5_9GAMM|nr:AAA family ATPase [Thorsellia anophelis]SET20887.1 MoxR-like ATPase [Thorsellia anophelis DSM 18579]
MNSQNSMQNNIQRLPAEIQYAAELNLLIETDTSPRPPGWSMSLNAARKFILGDSSLGIERKIVANISAIERMLVSLATGRGLMLVGEPGTAKSLLSELLAAAICGTSSLTIQGGASTTEDQIKYSWNYALLINEGPSTKALVPAPLYQAMKTGKIVRFEELTRVPLEVQDCLLGMLSDRVMVIAELNDGENLLYAKEGFNIIATANTRDRGVNEMSAALKRRFDFETVFPIMDFDQELELISSASAKLLEKSNIPHTLPKPILEILVTTFRDLRNAAHNASQKGGGMDGLTAVLSTAEAINVAHAAGIRAWFLEQREANPIDLVESLAGTVVKDNPDDQAKLKRYFEHKVAKRSGNHWQTFYQARHRLP